MKFSNSMRMSQKLIIAFALLLLVPAIITKPIIIEPTNSSGEEIGFIFVQGAAIAKESYIPLSKQIQSSLTNLKTWVAITDTTFDLPLSVLGTIAINECRDALFGKGFNKSNRLYVIGHSLGGLAALNYYTANTQILSGAIMLGSLPERNQREQTKNFNLLIIGGELDGLSRITRTTEEFYHIINDNEKLMYFENNSQLNFLESKANKVSSRSLVIVIRGANHMSFASGEPSTLVGMRDLKAEISEEEAHHQIADLISKYVNNQEELIPAIQDTYKLIKPIITAYELEGSKHFNRPNQSICKRGYCGPGNEWTKIAQKVIVDADYLKTKGVEVQVSNDYVYLSSLPPLGDLFHPKINFDAENKIYDIKTYSECAWDTIDKWVDGGFAPTSASEIGSKMSSRQCSYVYAAGHRKEETPMTIDTEGNLCTAANKKAYEWALENSGKKSVDRFEQYGQKLNFIPDHYYVNGFSWTTSVLNWNENKTTGEMDIQSFTMVTDIDAKPLPIFAPDGLDCYHYCKLLSPARALEWIYVDGLRKNYHINK